MIPGIDVSHWQREIDWSEVKRSGVKFAFVKATEFPDKKTSLFVDEQLRSNINGASQNNIIWGAYHFFRTHIDPVIQAKVYCETVGDFSSMPPVLDLEVAGSKGERLNYKVRQFLEETERITGRKPVIYSNGGFWRSYMTCEKYAHADWARAYPLWMAQFTALWPTPLYPWAGWDFWQYTDKGKIPGVITHVDLNWYNGSVEDLQRKFVLPAQSNPISLTSEPEDEVIPVQDDAVVGREDSQKAYQPFSKEFEIYRGDYQEPGRQRRHVQIQHPSNGKSQRKVIRKIDGDQKEDEWIRSYFMQNNG